MSKPKRDCAQISKLHNSSLLTFLNYDEVVFSRRIEMSQGYL